MSPNNVKDGNFCRVQSLDLLQAPRLSQSLPSDPTKFESDSVEEEEAKTVAEIRRWARRLHAEEGLDGFSPTSEYRGVSWHSGKGNGS